MGREKGHWIDCPNCGGTGWNARWGLECSMCQGTGRIMLKLYRVHDAQMRLLRAMHNTSGSGLDWYFLQIDSYAYAHVRNPGFAEMVPERTWKTMVRDGLLEVDKDDEFKLCITEEGKLWVLDAERKEKKNDHT